MEFLFCVQDHGHARKQASFQAPCPPQLHLPFEASTQKVLHPRCPLPYRISHAASKSRIPIPLLQRLRLQRNPLLAGSLLFVVGLHPVLPVLAGGAILAAELNAGDLGVAHLALLGRVGTVVLHPGVGQRGAGVAVEDVGLNLFRCLAALAVLQCQSYVAAIVEGLIESLPQVLVIGQRGNPTFKILVLSAGSQLQRLHLLQRVLQHFGGHARVSSRTGSVFSALAAIFTRFAGPCGVASFSSFSACSSRYRLNVPRTIPQNPLSDPNPSITALGS